MFLVNVFVFMGRAIIRRKKAVLNAAISILLGLIFGFVLIVLIEESLGILNYPPLLEAGLMWSFTWQEARIPYYQAIVLINMAILGLNLGPGLLTILESANQQPPEPWNGTQLGESHEVGISDSMTGLTERHSPTTGFKDSA